jgi:diguanylate cyclase (GGDEF)-like protein
MIIVWLLIVAALVGTTFYSGHVMDRVALENQRALIDNAITSRLNQGLSEMRSIAWWNDMVTNTDPKSFNSSWLDLEVGSYMVETFNHKRIYVLSEANKPTYLYGDSVTLDSPIVRQDMKVFAPLVKQARGGLDVSPRVIPAGRHTKIYEYIGNSNRKFSRAFGSVVNLEGKPALAMAMLITPTVDTDEKPPLRRLVLSLIAIDDQALKRFGQDTLMTDLSFKPPSADRQGTFLLKTDDGQALAQLSWTPKRPGTEMIRRLLPWIAIALMFGTGIFLVLMKRLFASNRQLSAREEEARFLADHDALTGLPNRRMLERIYEERLCGPKSIDSRLIVACIDLDRFKDINDTMGHHAGDDLIKAVGVRLQNRLEENDTLARLGGDEFAVLRPVPWMSNVDGLTDLVSGCFEEPFDVTGHMIECNASIGLAFADRNDSFDQSIKRADIALYDAKASGRGRSSRFTAAMSQSLEKRHAIETDLRRALSAGDLTLNYQPIIEAHTGAISSVEALVRWVSPTHGQVAPDLFVNIAEESGMMAQLGRFVIDQAFADARRWPDLTTAINISPAQLRSATIVSDLLGASKRCGIAPKMITLEITETVLMSNDERTLRVLNTLKENGFALALDDFGTGYSSLAYLRDFPFDRLKIDRSFVKGLSVNDRALSIVEAVVNFGHILGRDVVAEGIETEQEMQAMQQAGCTHLQGWLFSKALPADHIEALAATFGRLSARRDFSGDEIPTSSVAEAAPAQRKTNLRPRRRRSI